MRGVLWAYLYMCVGLGITVALEKRTGDKMSAYDRVIGIATWPGLVSGQVYLNYLKSGSTVSSKRTYNIGGV